MFNVVIVAGYGLNDGGGSETLMLNVREDSGVLLMHGSAECNAFQLIYEPVNS